MRYLPFTFAVLLAMTISCRQTVNHSESKSDAKAAKRARNRAEVKGANTGPNDPSLAIFKNRILPIFQSQKPSSCTECHLSGVDLKDYIHADQQVCCACQCWAG